MELKHISTPDYTCETTQLVNPSHNSPFN